MSLTKSKRYLPHWRQKGATYFVTFRVTSGFQSSGGFSLPERVLIIEQIRYLHPVPWEISISVVLQDHCHLIVTPQEDSTLVVTSLSKGMQLVKGRTSRMINIARSTSGSIWMSESYDRIIRNEADYAEKVTYIVNNASKVTEDPYSYPALWFPGKEE